MLILYAAMKFDYGKPEQGYSFEHYNFHDSLLHMGHDILYFDFMTLLQSRGRDGMNRRLIEVAKAEKPGLMFTVLFTDELDRKAVRQITDDTDTVTINWFCDDHWRFDGYSRHWAGCFNWVVTTAASALPKYENAGIHNVIKSQWACNSFLYRKLPLPLVHDVSFVGQPHGNRREIIQAVKDAGIQVDAWGTGWPSGRLSQETMIRTFNQSRINLNLANASVSGPASASPAPGALRRTLSRSLDRVPLGAGLKRAARRGMEVLRASASGARPPASAGPQACAELDQIKGRNFEIPGSGGFLLTGRADDLECYYEIGKEIVCFDGVDDLIGKLRHYLAHEEERAAIARAGYERTLREHTYTHRFRDILRRAGVAGAPAAPTAEARPGRTVDVT